MDERERERERERDSFDDRPFINAGNGRLKFHIPTVTELTVASYL